MSGVLGKLKYRVFFRPNRKQTTNSETNKEHYTNIPRIQR